MQRTYQASTSVSTGQIIGGRTQHRMGPSDDTEVLAKTAGYMDRLLKRAKEI
jgi:hypothetical protein